MYATDWEILHTAADDLEAYLLSKELYWLVRGSRLSPGNLLLSIARLQSKPDYDPELRPLLEKIYPVRNHWQSAWRLKAEREMDERLRMWQRFVEELRSSDAPAQTEYNTQVRFRAILGLLAVDVGLSIKNELVLDALDDQLRHLTAPGKFVWEPEIAAGFDEQKFWYLYRGLQAQPLVK